MPNDIRRLKEEADIEKVIDFLGLPVKKRGSAFFILCPRKDHDDTHATNCYFKKGWNHVFCSVCGRATYAVDIIANVLGTGYGKACDILWELSGRPGWYYGDDQEKSYCITHRDADLIGLHLPSRIQFPAAVSDTKFSDKKNRILPELYTKNGKLCIRYISCRTEYCHWSDFVTDRELADMVITKAEEKEEIFRSMAEMEDMPEEFKDACTFLMKDCQRIAKEASLFTGQAGI